MAEDRAQILRKSIENLIDAKILDVVGKPGGLDRLLAHRRTGVASFDIRQAERKLEEALADFLSQSPEAQQGPVKPDISPSLSH